MYRKTAHIYIFHLTIFCWLLYVVVAATAAITPEVLQRLTSIIFRDSGSLSDSSVKVTPEMLTQLLRQYFLNAVVTGGE